MLEGNYFIMSLIERIAVFEDTFNFFDFYAFFPVIIAVKSLKIVSGQRGRLAVFFEGRRKNDIT